MRYGTGVEVVGGRWYPLRVKKRVYIETSVLSYLTARPSRDVVQSARQQLTIEWWDRRELFELVISEPVLDEARRGDPSAAARRVEAASGITVLPGTTQAEALATSLILTAAMPKKAVVDAAHVALAAVHRADFLLTWNCTHIANAVMRPKIEAVCREAGFDPPVICTPDELMNPEDI